MLHSVAQLEDRYGQAAARTIWATCGTKIFLPGTTDPETLRNVAQLLGTVHDGERHVDLCPPELLRTLPNWRALVISMNRDPVIVKIRPVWKRPGRRFPLRYFTSQVQRPAFPALPEAVDVPAVTGPVPGTADDYEPAQDTDVIQVPAPRENAWPPVSGYDPRGRG